MNQSRHRLKKIHFIGIGGSGMSGIAEVLINLGYQVSGSDIQESNILDRLNAMGAKIFLTHKESNINSIDMVVLSSAIHENNIELKAARKRSIPILARAEMLSSLMNMKRGIAIAGTHGKTTTTSLLASIFTEADLDPTFINGGVINSFASNAKLGKGKYLIAEADESDKSFLMLQPSMAVITNIEADHLINYDNDFNNLKNAFLGFVKKLPFNGLLVACGDDNVIKNMLSIFSRPKVTYGFDLSNDYVITDYKAKDFKWATELANYILAIERQHQEARQLKSWSIKALAYASESANERNYLLTQAMMLDGHISLAVIAKAGAARGLPDTYRSADAMVFLHTLGARLNVEAAKQTDLRFRVILNDRDGRYVVDIDRGVLLTSKEQITDVAFTLNVSHKDLALACEGLVAK